MLQLLYPLLEVMSLNVCLATLLFLSNQLV